MNGNKIKLAMIEDSKELCEIFAEFFEKHERFEFLGSANKADDGLELIQRVKPDIVLIDIILPSKDGISILEELQQKERVYKPICIMLTGVNRETITERALTLGAEYVFLKPFQIDIMARRLIQIYESNSSAQMGEYENEKYEIRKNEKAIHIEEHLTHLLTSFGIAVHLKGYKYVRRAIILCIEDEAMLEGITKILYPEIAKEYKTSVMSVEHGIRNALTSAWSKQNSANYYKVLGIDDISGTRPTNTSFISNIVDYFNIKVINRMNSKNVYK